MDLYRNSPSDGKEWRFAPTASVEESKPSIEQKAQELVMQVGRLAADW